MPSLPSPRSVTQESSGVPHAPPLPPRPLVYRLWLCLFFAANTASLLLFLQHHFAWAIAVFFVPAPWYAWQVIHPAASGLAAPITRFATSRREIWLTVDDGPDPSSTPALLDLLERHEARATFFLIGEKAAAHPELVSEILRRGHTVGNHSHSHAPHRFWFASARWIASQIDRGNEVLLRAGSGPLRLFRSPVGLKNHALQPELDRRAMHLVLWSARGFDAREPDSAKALARILPDIRPGAIILVHETPGDPARQDALVSGLLNHLAEQGYRCVLPSPEALLRPT